MSVLHLTLDATLDGVPVPGFMPLVRALQVREAFVLKRTATGAGYVSSVSLLSAGDGVIVSFFLMTTDTTITCGLFDDDTPVNPFTLSPNKLFLFAGNTVPNGVNPFLRIAVPTGTATMTMIYGIK